MSTSQKSKYFTPQQVRAALINREEIALLDVREEAIFAEGHPLFAANFSVSNLETEAFTRIPNKDTNIVIYDDGEGLAHFAAERLIYLGYTNVAELEGGLKGWKNSGGEIFRDVNSPSKAFGELVESKRHTPSLTAQEVKSLIESNQDVVILDARRPDEYYTMSIPTSTSVPGAELLLRVKELASNPDTTIIVNCAGRTRSIIGTQSLLNAGIDNQVFALRNGTIGWTLAGLSLDHGQNRSVKNISAQNLQSAIVASRKVADAACVNRLNFFTLRDLRKDVHRTTYYFDVREKEEYLKGHIPGFLHVPGGQLVQETDHYAVVRGARIILADDLQVRANMTASWLAQMNWEVYVLEGTNLANYTEHGEAERVFPVLPALHESLPISPKQLKSWFDDRKSFIVIDLARVEGYLKQRIPGSWYVLLSQLKLAVENLPFAENYVLTSPDGIQAAFVADELENLVIQQIYVLEGGTIAWIAEQFPTENTAINSHFASPQVDRYRRPYEGTNNSEKAMQAYLDWEYGLVEQLERDGTHGFFVI